MKKTIDRNQSMKNKFVLLAVLSAACATTLTATSITITNFSFEDATDPAKVATGFDDAGTANIIGWNNAGTVYSDTGVEPSNIAGVDGTRASFLRGIDDGAYNVTGYTMSTGDFFTASWLAYNIYQGVNQNVVLFSTTDGGVTRQTLATYTGEAGGGAFDPFGMTYTAVSADNGKQIGFLISNPSGGDFSWVGYDKFQLDVAPIPEPSTMAVLGIMGVGLLARRKVRRSEPRA